MPPGLTLVSAANAALADPNFRESVKQMHAEAYPLVQMVEALGLDDEMTARVREIVEGLSPDVVDAIRAATLAMLETGEYVLPLDCLVSEADLDAGAPVHIDVAAGAVAKIRVRPAGEA